MLQLVPLLSTPKINWSSEDTNDIVIDYIQALKKFVSGEKIGIERKGKDRISYEPKALGVFNSNKNPIIKGNQLAITSRYTTIPFNKAYSMWPKAGQLQADPRFKNNPEFVKTQVCPAFLNILIDGFKYAYEHGISYDKATEHDHNIALASNHLKQFCDDSLLFLTQQWLQVTSQITFSLSEGYFPTEKSKLTDLANTTDNPIITGQVNTIETKGESNLSSNQSNLPSNQSNLPSNLKVTYKVSSNPCESKESNLQSKNPSNLSESEKSEMTNHDTSLQLNKNNFPPVDRNNYLFSDQKVVDALKQAHSDGYNFISYSELSMVYLDSCDEEGMEGMEG